MLVPKDEDLMGKMIEVEIVETGKHYMKGKLLVSKHSAVRPDVPLPLKKGQVSGLSKVRRAFEVFRDEVSMLIF